MNFYGFVKPVEYMHGLEKAIQENIVMLLWADQTTDDNLSSGIKGEANLKYLRGKWCSRQDIPRKWRKRKHCFPFRRKASTWHL